jgi:hypothetical protein
MNSEKVKEIKEKLQEEIFIANSFGDKLRKVPTKELQNLLTLINEVESENERLIAEKQKVLEYMKTDNYAKLKKEDMYWGYQMGIGMLEHEINRQKDRIAELEKENAKYKRKLTISQWAQEIRNEALKQFAERLKEKYGKSCSEYYPLLLELTSEQLDETLKEFTT